MCAYGKFSLLDRVFRVPFLGFNDVASAIISSSMERFRLALALPGARTRIAGLWRARPRRGHEAVPATAVARRRGAVQRTVRRDSRKARPGAADRLGSVRNLAPLGSGGVGQPNAAAAALRKDSLGE
jgi:hypothetical protein